MSCSRFFASAPGHSRHLVLGLLLAATTAAHSAVVTQNTIGTFTSKGFGAPGQSVTTPAGGPWKQIAFNFYSPELTAVASGSLFLLSQAYTGASSGLGSSTAGFIASTNTVSGGAWVFNDLVTLNASTQYFLYAPNIGQALRFAPGSANAYAGGNAYFGAPTYAASLGDLSFLLTGTKVTVPEPGSLMLSGAALALLIGASRASRRSNRRS